MFGSKVGEEGLRRFSARAKKSSVVKRILVLREEQERFVYVVNGLVGISEE